MKLNIENIVSVAREGVNKFNARLLVEDNGSLPVSFERVQKGWNIILRVSVDGRAFHEVEPSDFTYDEAKRLWSVLDDMASVNEARAEAWRQNRRFAVIRAFEAKTVN